MRATVLRDPGVLEIAGRFVWLELDTERADSASFLEAYPVDVWPTFLVIDPATERPVRKWFGSASAPELRRLLEDGERAVRGAPREGLDAILARADEAHAAGREAEALVGYRQALALGGARWTGRGRALESLLVALQASGDLEDCVRTAVAEMPELARGSSFVNGVGAGLSCALSAPEEARWRDDAISVLEPLASKAARLPALAADDRSGLFELLVEARGERLDSRGAHRAARDWWRFLAAERARAKTPEARAALDSARVSAALALGDPARALPALKQSERELPGDDNPPARLARLHRELGRLDEAMAAVGRAVRLAYGPRKLRHLELQASIQEARGDSRGARASLEEALTFAATLPPTQRPGGWLRSVQARLVEMP